MLLLGSRTGVRVTLPASPPTRSQSSEPGIRGPQNVESFTFDGSRWAPQEPADGSSRACCGSSSSDAYSAAHVTAATRNWRGYDVTIRLIGVRYAGQRFPF